MASFSRLEIFDWVREQTGAIPPVVDARMCLQNPGTDAALLCEAIGVDFDPAMLSWPPGLRETDGIWAKHWYGEVAKSTRFAAVSHRRTNQCRNDCAKFMIDAANVMSSFTNHRTALEARTVCKAPALEDSVGH